MYQNVFDKKTLSSSTNRFVILQNKTDVDKLSAKPQTLKSLPLPFELNMKFAHFVVIMMDPLQFGLEKDQDKKILLPTMLPNQHWT